MLQKRGDNGTKPMRKQFVCIEKYLKNGVYFLYYLQFTVNLLQLSLYFYRVYSYAHRDSISSVI